MTSRRMGVRMGVPLLALVVLSTVVSACAQPDTRGDLERALQEFVATENGPPGIAVVIQRGQRRTFHVAGVASLETGDPARIDDHTRVASVAKAFSGATALAVVRAGRLTLSDTIGQWLPDLPQRWHRVTLGQLLQHTSGIVDFSTTDAFREALINSLQVPPPPRELLSFVEDTGLKFTPGTEYEYSNSDNIVVGLMVEAATGLRYERALGRYVTRPYGLTETSLPTGSSLETPRINGYDLNVDAPPDDVTELFAAGWTWASGGVVSTPVDANQFIRSYVPQVLDFRGLGPQRFQFAPGGSEPTGPGRNSAGPAIFRYRTHCGIVYGHTGNTSGYTQFVAASRDGRRSVSVSVNAQVTPTTNSDRFPALRNIFELATCHALS